MTPVSLKSILQSKKRWVVLIGLAMLYRSAWTPFDAGVTKYIYDSINSGNISISTIILVCAITLFAGASSLVLQNLAVDLFVKKVTFELSTAFMKSLLRQSVRSLAEMGDGAVLTNFSQDINAVSGLIRNGIQIIRIPFVMLVAAGYLLYTNAFFGIIALVLLPPAALVGKKIGKSLEEINKKYLTKNDGQLKMIGRIIKTITVIKTYASEKPVEQEFRRITADKYALDRKQARYGAVFSGLLDFSIQLPFLIILILGALLFQIQNITVGTLVLFLILMNNLTVPFTFFNTILVQYRQAKVSLDRLNVVLTVPGDGDETRRATTNAIQSIRFDEVSFAYHDRAVINSLSGVFDSGRHYAVIGENGSGKTTFIKLLLNLFSADSGMVAANGIDYRSLFFNDLRSNNKIVYIEDDPAALFDSFDRNITLGGEKDEGRFAEVLQAVGLYDQYPELARKNADELSAGQKQRLAIARGLYHLKNETVLVMDEPFSALDANGSGKMRGVFADCKNKYHLTIFEITHNLNDMDRFDYVYYFEDGKVLYEGTHTALMEQDKYRLYVQSRVEQLS
jgi:ABC-type bacteriocin/lantibiotic exporter with double-glycine peptidase domain